MIVQRKQDSTFGYACSLCKVCRFCISCIFRLYFGWIALQIQFKYIIRFMMMIIILEKIIRIIIFVIVMRPVVFFDEFDAVGVVFGVR